MHDNARKCTIAAGCLSAICWRLLELCGGVSMGSGMKATATAKIAKRREGSCGAIPGLRLRATFGFNAPFAVAVQWIPESSGAMLKNKAKQSQRKTSLAKRKWGNVQLWLVRG
jgi:hypothetical protein